MTELPINCCPGSTTPVSDHCIAEDYLMRHCPILKEVNKASKHACPFTAFLPPARLKGGKDGRVKKTSRKKMSNLQASRYKKKQWCYKCTYRSEFLANWEPIEEVYDCPIHGKLAGIDECPLC